MPDAIGEYKVWYTLMAYCDLLQYYWDNKEASEYIALSNGRTLDQKTLEEEIAAIFSNLDEDSWLRQQEQHFFVQGAQWARTDAKVRKLVRDFSASEELLEFKRNSEAAFADKFFFIETIRLSQVTFTNPKESSKQDPVIVIVGNEDAKRAEIILHLAGREEEKEAVMAGVRF